jgi:plasmid stabilization system protein ParE
VSPAFEFSPQARRDFYGILDYLAERSPSGAERVRVAIMRAIRRLAERPGMGHSREDLTDRPLRFWSVIGRYTIVYRDDQPIEILRIFGPGRDIESALR